MSPAPDSGPQRPVLVAAAASVAVIAMLIAHWAPGATTAAWNVAWTAAAVSALAGVLEGRRAAPGRQQWNWLAAGTASWLLGQLAWDTFAVVGAPPSPNIADFGWWGFAALIMIGLLRAQGRSPVLRIVGMVEALLLIAAAMALTLAGLWSDVVSSPAPTATQATALLYPALYLSAAVLTLQAMVAGPLRRTLGAGISLILGGIIAQALAFTLWSGPLLDESYVVGQAAIDPLWVLGLIAIGAGGVIAPRTSPDASEGNVSGDVGAFLPAVMFALLAGALVRAELISDPLGPRLVLAFGVVTCGITLILRGVLLSSRQRGLLRREREARLALSEREGKLEQLNERLAEDSRHDPLTGLRNRRALAEELPEIERHAERHGSSYGIALCDVDHFKAYNDELGHLAGDDALRVMADATREQLRAGDVAYRYGGEELLLVLRDSSIEDALTVAERVHSAVRSMALPHPQGIGGIMTVSIGVAAGSANAATLLGRADAALYAAKRAGRDRVLTGEDHAGAVVPVPVLATNVEEPILRQLRSVTAVSRAASAQNGAIPVLEALARTIRSELGFATVCVNLRDFERDIFEVVVVLGPERARSALMGTSSAWSTWEAMLGPEYERHGASWLPAGSYEWSPSVPSYTPDIATTGAGDSWDPEDALMLPLRNSAGEVLAVVSVDEPRSGRRPSDSELQVLMAVVDHAATVLEQLRHDRDTINSLMDQPAQERLEAVLLLAETLDLRDTATADHSRTVGAYARAIAEALQLGPERVDRIHKAGVLHDLGKLAIPDVILQKPGALNEAESREVRRHPEIGARILNHAGLPDIADWVLTHHERIDGDGYPRGLQGRDIPLEAKILAVADAYEAIVSDRPYRAGMSADAAQRELRARAGTQFDGTVVDALLGTLDVGDANGGIAAQGAAPRRAPVDGGGRVKAPVSR